MNRTILMAAVAAIAISAPAQAERGGHHGNQDQAAPHAQFHATSGLGHHRLLGNAEVIAQVVRFVASAVPLKT